MSEQNLDDADIGAILQKAGGKAATTASIGREPEERSLLRAKPSAASGSIATERALSSG
jgi:hypothetical protein